MPKRDNLKDDVDDIKIKMGIEEGIHKWVRTVCITSTTACFSFLVWLGTIAYDKFPAIKAAIITFIQTDKGQS